MIPITVKDLYFLSVVVTIQLANQIGSPLLKERIVEALAFAAKLSTSQSRPMEMFLLQLHLCMDWRWRKWIKTSSII
jgi:hypothetical protein